MMAKLIPFFLMCFVGLLPLKGVSAEQGVYWIDVRTAAEYSKGHLAGAINIPHQQIAEKIHAVTGDKQADIRVYCRSGRRSGVAKDTLKRLGYTRVTNEGGYSDLTSKKERPKD